MYDRRRWIVSANWVEPWAKPVGIFDCGFAIADLKPRYDSPTQPPLENRQSAFSMSRFFRYKLLVVRRREQSLKFARIFQGHLQHPGAMRVLVDLLGRRGQVSIDFGHSARCGSEQVRHGLDGLDGSEGLACRQFCPDLRRFDKDNVSERFLSV